MISAIKQVRTVLAAAVLVASLAGVQTAFAAGTDAGVTIGNRATVNYTVGTTAQSPIESSPLGNSNPGVGNGANTNFVVDRRIDFTVVETGGGFTTVAPGQINAVTIFTVANTSNAAQGFQLSAANVGGTVFGNNDNSDVGNIRVFVDNPAGGGTAGAYDPLVDTALHINTLGEDLNVVVFVVSDVPPTATNGQFANVRLTARAATVGSNGATLETETAGADTAGMDVVFGDAARDATETADDQYAVQSAALTITKSSSIISDLFNGTGPNRKAIPGSVIEYVVSITNNGTAAATSVRLSDTLDANLDFATGQYNGGAADVQIDVGASTTYCLVEDGADANGDGCNRAGQTLNVNPVATITVAPTQTATVRFRATIL
ncbi:MAG TPA: hypothetical protein VLD59_05275 [Steroidobacteraceae bacterium]|nr:hypothetical protein [Steroidobacteraceae bacterium]